MLKTYFSGSAVSIYREGDNTIPIALRAGAATYQSLEGLTSATFAKNGTLISLAQIATLRTGFDFSRIRRKNQERMIIVSGRSASLTAGDLLNFIQPGLRALDLSGGYHIDFGGEIQKSEETNGKLAAGIPAALAVMVIAIILQFNSFRRGFFGSPPYRSRAILLARIVGGIEIFKAERAERRYLRDVLPGFRPTEMGSVAGQHDHASRQPVLLVTYVVEKGKPLASPA